MKIIDLLKNSAENEPRRTAVVSGESEVSYKQLFAEVSALSEKLKQAGCSPGVKVAVVLNNSVEYLAGFFSISATGATIVPLSMRMTPREVAGYAEKADVSIIVTSRSYGEVLAEQLRSSENMTLLYVQYDTDTGLHVKVSTSSQCKVDDENADVALMVPTSGTTGAPKMVMLTDDNLISNMAAYRLLMGFEGHNVVYCGLSLHHIYCICAQILTHISLADTFAVDDRPFFIRDFFKAVGRYAITATAFVPYMAILMAEYPDAGRFDLDSLKFITISGAKMPTSKYKVLTDKYASVRFINTYGMSEAGSRISIAAPLPSKFPADSVGRPMPGVNLRITDAEGNTAPADSPGEIMIKSSGVMKGYYRQPDLTAETITDGWLRTGDIGKLDANGNLYMLGRTKDIIITGGENISPFEVEACLIEHLAIREAAVVGRRDQLLQEVPCAFLVKNDHPEKPTELDIMKFCKNRLSSHKVPRSVRFLAELPKLGTSKVDRNTLRKMAETLH